MAQPAAMSAEPPRPVEWASLSFEGAALEGYVLAERYLLKRFTSLVRGSYGLPFEGLDCASGEPVFIKLLSSAAVTSEKVGRELRTCATLLAAQEEWPRPGARYLATVRAVLPAASAQRDGTTIVNLPALVMDWYPGGDGHRTLFAEQRRTQPLPEPLARHLFRQLTEVRGLDCGRDAARRAQGGA
jgi:serine/threonine protein kinase